MTLTSSFSSADLPPHNYKVIKSVDTFHISKNGESTQTNDSVFQIINEAGRTELSLYRLSYFKSLQTFKLLTAYSQGGRHLNHVDHKTIKTATPQDDPNGLSDRLDIIIPFTNLQIGSLVHLTYEIKSAPIVEGEFSQLLTISNSILGKDESYQFRSAKPLKVYEDGFENYFTYRQSQVGNEYRIEVRPTQTAYLLEGQREINGTILVSTSQSWLSLNQNLAPSYLRVLAAPLPLSLKTISLKAMQIKDVKTQVEFVAAEINRQITYSADWTTKNGKYIPNDLTEITKKGQGDCKDFSAAMVSVLRDLNYEAATALTFRSDNYVGPDRIKKLAVVPNLSMFNHAIVWMKDRQGKVWWMDPTNPVVTADVLSRDILGNLALILDGKSGEVQFLPSANSESSQTTIEQKVVVQADNSVLAQGQIQMNVVAANAMAMVERRFGGDTLKRLFSATLNPTSKMSLTLEKTAANAPAGNQSSKTVNAMNARNASASPNAASSASAMNAVNTAGAGGPAMSYKFSLSATDWMATDKGRFKAITIFNPLASHTQVMKKDIDFDFGETARFKLITHLESQHVPDPIHNDCNIKSPWLDFERAVENRSPLGVGVDITDTLVVKKRYVSKSETRSESYKFLISSIADCLQNMTLILEMDESQKTREMTEREKWLGPPVESMTDANANQLELQSQVSVFEYIQKKLARYYSLKIKKNPKDAIAYWKRGAAVRQQGYIKDGRYVDEYVLAGLADVEKATHLSGATYVVKMHAERVMMNLALKRFQEATFGFRGLMAKAPRDFETFNAGFKLAFAQKQLEMAEKWGRGSEALIKDREQTRIFHKNMSEYYGEKQNFKAQTSHLEFLAQDDPSNAWAWHNLATNYFSRKDYDKVIIAEKKALALSDFGIARHVLSNAMVKKSEFHWNLDMTKVSREPAATTETESLLLEAIKWESENIEALTKITLFYASRTFGKKDKSFLTKARPYIERALALDPKNQNVLSAFTVFKMADQED